jgi:hypothetical protein
MCMPLLVCAATVWLLLASVGGERKGGICVLGWVPGVVGWVGVLLSLCSWLVLGMTRRVVEKSEDPLPS